MKYQIKRFWFDEVLFEADVPDGCEQPARFALKKAVAAGICLRGANLEGADLAQAILNGADLVGANLKGAHLRFANLSGANLKNADLSGADLKGSNLRDANLRGASLWRTDLRDVELCNTDLCYADLSFAVLSNASLYKANLHEPGNFHNTQGNQAEIKSLRLENYSVVYTATHMQIQDECHPLEHWWNFSDDDITRMNEFTLEWWKKWKPVIQQIVELSPAVPGAEKPPEQKEAA